MRAKQLLIFLVGCLLLFIRGLSADAHNSCNSFGLEKALYVNQFINVDQQGKILPAQSILGDTEKETQLLQFALDNGYNNLVLYNIPSLFNIDRCKAPGQHFLKSLKKFIHTARNTYHISSISAEVNGVRSDYTCLPAEKTSRQKMIYAVLSELAGSDTLKKPWSLIKSIIQRPGNDSNGLANAIFQCLSVYKLNKSGAAFFDGLTLEDEYWNSAVLKSGFNRHIDMLKIMQAVKQLPNSRIRYVADYFDRFVAPAINGDPSEQAQADALAASADRMLLTYYNNNIELAISDGQSSAPRYAARLRYFDAAVINNKLPRKLDILPLFNNSYHHFIDYTLLGTGQNPETSNRFGDNLHAAPGTSSRIAYKSNTCSFEYYRDGSTWQMQEAFYRFFQSLTATSDSSSGSAGPLRNLRLAGFQWFRYTFAPRIVYQYDKDARLPDGPGYAASGGTSVNGIISNKIEYLYLDKGPVELRAYNSGSFEQKDADYENTSYTWYREGSAKPLVTTDASGAAIKVNRPGKYYVVTKDFNGCSEYSRRIIVKPARGEK